MEHIMNRVFDAPLMILPEKLEIIATYLLNRQAGKPITLFETSHLQKECFQVWTTKLQTSNIHTLPSGISVFDKVAVIPVLGTLVYRGGMNPISKMTSYTSLQNQIKAAIDDAAVDSIILDIDSPGGEANGSFDLSDYIYAMRTKKKIVAVANQVATSGAYLIGSSASRFYVSRTSQIGSIGVIVIHKEVSQALEHEGIKITAIYEGSHKIDLAPFEPLTDSARERAQATVKQIYELFVDTTARNRNISQKQIRGTEAAVYMGEEAVNMKLADKILTIRTVFESLRNKGGNSKMYVSNINIPVMDNDLETELDNIGVTQVPVTQVPVTQTPVTQAPVTQTPVMQKTPETQTPVMQKTPSHAPVYIETAAYLEAERDRVIGLYNICSEFGCMATFQSYVKRGTSIASAKEIIALALETRGIIIPLNTTASGTPGTKENPLIANAKKRAAEIK